MEAANYCFEHKLGRLYGWFSREGLRLLRLPTPDQRYNRIPVLHSSMNDHRVWALHAVLEPYFAGVRQDFSQIPLDLSSGTHFQSMVWHALRDIPWGETITYGELARRIGMPGAARAVGQAVGANPIPILLPCHRVRAASGLGGFSAGIEWKKELLSVEGVIL